MIVPVVVMMRKVVGRAVGSGNDDSARGRYFLDGTYMPKSTHGGLNKDSKKYQDTFWPLN